MGPPGFVIAAILYLAVTGCAALPMGPYEKFARAGLDYSASLNELLVVAQKTAIDSNSAQVIATNMDADRSNEKFVEQEVNSLSEFNAIDERRMAVFNDIRKQSAELGNYFKLLNQLVTADEAGSTSAAVRSSAKAIDDLSAKLTGQTIFSLSSEQKSAISHVVSFVVDAKQSTELKKAINRDEAVLQKALNTQSELLQIIGDDLGKSMAMLNQRQSQMLLEAPLTARNPLGQSPSAVKKWMDNRRNILTANTGVGELETAGKAARSLQESLRKLLDEDEAFDVELAQLRTELESMHRVVQALH